jgi:hypothetical protein
MKRRAGLVASILKNSSRRPQVRQEKRRLSCRAGFRFVAAWPKDAVSDRVYNLDRRGFAAGGNRPNDPFNRIP